MSVVNAGCCRSGRPKPSGPSASPSSTSAARARGELPSGVRIFGPGATVAQDLEPEYIAIDHANPFRAYVTLQENNAIAVLDLAAQPRRRDPRAGYEGLHGAGFGLDPSDRDSSIAINTWPVRGMFLPDGVDAFRVRAGPTWQRRMRATSGSGRVCRGGPAGQLGISARPFGVPQRGRAEEQRRPGPA